MVTTLSGQTLETPFNTSISVAGINTTAIYPSTPTGGIIANVTTNVHNSTSGTGTLLDQISSNTFFVLSVLWLFWSFLSGGFIWNALGIFGFPSIFIEVIVAPLMVLGARNALYYFSGR